MFYQETNTDKIVIETVTQRLGIVNKSVTVIYVGKRLFDPFLPGKENVWLNCMVQTRYIFVLTQEHLYLIYIYSSYLLM